MNSDEAGQQRCAMCCKSNSVDASQQQRFATKTVQINLGSKDLLQKKATQSWAAICAVKANQMILFKAEVKDVLDKRATGRGQ